MKNIKTKYVKPKSQVFHVFAECQGGVKVSNTNMGPKPGGDASGGNSGSGGMNGNAKQNNWFDWDDEPSTDEYPFAI